MLHQQLSTRRATLSQSRPLLIGMAVHKDTLAVAYGAQDHGAEVTAIGTLGTRQCDLEQRIRKMPSKATPRILVDEAGSCGSWLARSLRQKDDACWVVAPRLLPTQAGERTMTAERCSPTGPPGSMPALSLGSLRPQVQDAAMRDRPGRVQRPSGLSKTPKAV